MFAATEQRDCFTDFLHLPEIKLCILMYVCIYFVIDMLWGKKCTSILFLFHSQKLKRISSVS